MSYMKRILNDIKQAKKLEDCGIYISFDEEKATEVHAVIEGVEDTPYYGGFFYFTLVFPSNYPLSPPRVTLRTTGNGSVRFNPNLYKCGKVCLSILGTWAGPGWTPGLTLSSVLLSIQTLLCPQPMCNEPGFENHENLAELKEYNSIIQHETLRVALLSNVKSIKNGTSKIPHELQQPIIDRFSKFFPHVSCTCRKNSSIDGRKMRDPFGERRGTYAFSDILRKFRAQVNEEGGENDIKIVSTEENDGKEDVVVDCNTEDNLKDEEENTEIPEELKCGVCFDILATPAVLECGHVFCYSCAQRWLDRNPICPTCRKRQDQVQKLRRIFAWDSKCEQEAKARNKLVAKVSSETKPCNDSNSDDFDTTSFELWCQRRDLGIELDNGKKLDEKKEKRQYSHGLGSGYGYDDDYHDDYFDDEYDDFDSFSNGAVGSHLNPGFANPPFSYFNHSGGPGNRLGSASSQPLESIISSSSVGATSHSLVVDQIDENERRKMEKEARLKRFGATSSATQSSEALTTSPTGGKEMTTTPSRPSSIFSVPSKFCIMSPEEEERERERVSREAELERLKKEKVERAKERKRLKLEIENDRKARKDNHGILPSSHDSLFSSSVSSTERLDSFQSKYDSKIEKEVQQQLPTELRDDSTTAVSNNNIPISSMRKIDALLDSICKPFQPSPGLSSNSEAEVDCALNLLAKIIGNIIEQPEVEKYRSINTNGKLYKEKLAKVLGVQRLLHALGFTKCRSQDGGSSLKFQGEMDSESMCDLISTRDKILSIIQCRKLTLEAIASVN